LKPLICSSNRQSSTVDLNHPFIESSFIPTRILKILYREAREFETVIIQKATTLSLFALFNLG
jgi:hypothetical protein